MTYQCNHCGSGCSYVAPSGLGISYHTSAYNSGHSSIASDYHALSADDIEPEDSHDSIETRFDPKQDYKKEESKEEVKTTAKETFHESKTEIREETKKTHKETIEDAIKKASQQN